jgi:hypothetical protein
MISDEPDEDADGLEDEELFGVLNDGGGSKSEACVEPATRLHDWLTLSRASNDALFVDNMTLGWFKAHHVDWRAEIATLLRAWVSLHVRGLPHVSPTPASPPSANC